MIRIKLQGADAVTAALRRLQSTVDDMRPAFQEIGEYLVDSTRRRFLRGVSPQGAPWAPKSEATMRAALGGEEAIVADPTGARVRLSMGIIDHYLADPKRLGGRERYFPLLPSLVTDLAEIWIGWARSE